MATPATCLVILLIMGLAAWFLVAGLLFLLWAFAANDYSK